MHATLELYLIYTLMASVSVTIKVLSFEEVPRKRALQFGLFIAAFWPIVVTCILVMMIGILCNRRWAMRAGMKHL